MNATGRHHVVTIQTRHEQGHRQAAAVPQSIGAVLIRQGPSPVSLRHVARLDPASAPAHRPEPVSGVVDPYDTIEGSRLNDRFVVDVAALSAGPAALAAMTLSPPGDLAFLIVAAGAGAGLLLGSGLGALTCEALSWWARRAERDWLRQHRPDGPGQLRRVVDLASRQPLMLDGLDAALDRVILVAARHPGIGSELLRDELTRLARRALAPDPHGYLPTLVTALRTLAQDHRMPCIEAARVVANLALDPPPSDGQPADLAWYCERLEDVLGASGPPVEEEGRRLRISLLGSDTLLTPAAFDFIARRTAPRLPPHARANVLLKAQLDHLCACVSAVRVGFDADLMGRALQFSALASLREHDQARALTAAEAIVAACAQLTESGLRHLLAWQLGVNAEHRRHIESVARFSALLGPRATAAHMRALVGQMQSLTRSAGCGGSHLQQLAHDDMSSDALVTLYAQLPSSSWSPRQVQRAFRNDTQALSSEFLHGLRGMLGRREAMPLPAQATWWSDFIAILESHRDTPREVVRAGLLPVEEVTRLIDAAASAGMQEASRREEMMGLVSRLVQLAQERTTRGCVEHAIRALDALSRAQQSGSEPERQALLARYAAQAFQNAQACIGRQEGVVRRAGSEPPGRIRHAWIDELGAEPLRKLLAPYLPDERSDRKAR